MAEMNDHINHLVKILEKTVSPDTAELEGAQKFLEHTAHENLPQFLLGLSHVLSNAENSQVVRIAAGLQLKNYLTSKDATIRLQCQKRWIQLDNDVKQSIKNNVMNTLGSEASGHSTAAQCIACIACAELPHGQWPQLIEILVTNVTSGNSTESTKESTLEAIGYICQDIEPHHLACNSNEILTAIMQGMRKEEPSVPVKLAATTALLNSLEFTKANFDTTNERHYIMTLVCEATQCSDTRVKVAALQCLVKILSLYYKYMEDYMKAALFAITIEAMKSDVDDIALQGIEFWSNVCDEEMDLAIEATEAMEQSRRPENYSRFYAKGALEFLVPILMKMLTKQDENDDEDDWNPCKSAGVCMMLLANCCENDVVQHVMPFVESNIKNPDWRYRDASVMAFGSILEGPDPTQLKTIVVQAMPYLIDLMNDQSVIVRDTVAWTIGRVCELLPEAVVNQAYFAQLLDVLLKGLEAEPRVSANICWAFSSLAEAAYEQASMAVEEEEEPETYQLSSNFSLIVSKLLITTNRDDAHQANLRNAAYEALMEMVKNSAKDCYKAVQDTTIVIMDRIQQILSMESHFETASDRMQYHDLQSLLCATLQSVLRKFQPEDAKMISDPVMNSLIHMLESTSGKSGGVQEDALLAVGTLIEVLNIDFNKYMDTFVVHLMRSLANTAEYQVCLAAVGLVGDICRALNAEILPICDEIMKLLLQNLSDKSVHRSVKPQILSVFGDIALAIGSQFEKYLQFVFSALNQASQAQVDKTDYDMVEYLNDLREGCLEAYTGIIQGLKGEENDKDSKARLELVWPHVEHMVNFIEYIAKDEDHTDSNTSCCAGLIGDLCSAFGPNMLQYLETKQDIHELLQEGRRSKTSKTKMLATWATKELRKLKQI